MSTHHSNQGGKLKFSKQERRLNIFLQILAFRSLLKPFYTHKRTLTTKLRLVCLDHQLWLLNGLELTLQVKYISLIFTNPFYLNLDLNIPHTMSRADKKTVIKSTDMTEEMQVEAVDTAKHVSNPTSF